MRWSTTEEKVAACVAKQAFYPESRVADYECPACGWHASSHGESGYGLDCPWGASPAYLEGRLGPRVQAPAGPGEPSALSRPGV